MKRTAQLKRNNKIVARWLNYEATKAELAEEYGLSWVQINTIIKKSGMTRGASK